MIPTVVGTVMVMLGVIVLASVLVSIYNSKFTCAKCRREFSDAKKIIYYNYVKYYCPNCGEEL